MVVVPAPFIRMIGAKPKDEVEVVAQPAKGELKVKFSTISQLILGEEFFGSAQRKKTKREN